MDKGKKIIKYITDKDYRFAVNAAHGLYHSMSDEEYLKRMFKSIMGYDLDLDNPRTFNEKLNWLKLHDRKPIYTTMVDKYEAKSFIADRVGEKYVIPTLGVWERFEDINFEELPDQFVLKTTHDSGGVVVCKDKRSFDTEKAKKIIKKSLKRKYYYLFREWPYKDVKPRIIAEKYLHDDVLYDLRDYKFFTFDGVAKALYITTNREVDRRTDFFDMDFKHLDIRDDDLNAIKPPQRPKRFEEMRDIAERISKGIPQLRVDFYEVNGEAYVGELTLFYSAGFVPFEPKEWDQKFGDWIKLPEIDGGGYLLIGDGYIIHLICKEDKTGLRDYKFYTFNGEPKLFCINTNRGGEGGLKVSYFSMDFNELDFTWGFPHPEKRPAIPHTVGKMIELARLLAKDTYQLRVDFYESGGSVYCGELTLFDGAGFEKLKPVEWYMKLGTLMQLPTDSGL